MLALAGGCPVIDGSGTRAAAEPGVVAGLFGWPPVLWTLRLGLLIVIATGTFVFALFVARFFRWEHMVAMARAPLPRFKEVGGKFAGVEATAKLADVDESLVAADKEAKVQIESLHRRIDDLTEYVDSLAVVVTYSETNFEDYDDDEA